MARVNVEQKALNDPRFRAVGHLMQCVEKTPRGFVEHACGLLWCVRVWDQCQERGSDILPVLLAECIQEGLADALVKAELAEKITETELRIKGAKDRCLWLSECRSAGKSGGKKGGRPAKPLGVKVAKTPTGSAQKTPPTPTPTLCKEEPPFPPELDTPAFHESWKAWRMHRHEIKKSLKPTMVSRQLKTLASMGLNRAIRCIEHTIEKGWVGLREPDENAPLPAGSSPARPATSFEMAHGRYNGQTGFARDAQGNVILDRLCKDQNCEHCKPRRTGGGA